MSTTKSATQSKLEQARAEHAARKSTVTHESEPDFVHAAAIEDIVEASPSVYRRIISFVASIFTASATYYYGAMAANILIAAVAGLGFGFFTFLTYMLCIAVLWIATLAAGWFTHGAVMSGDVVNAVSSKVSGWFKSAKDSVTPTTAAA